MGKLKTDFKLTRTFAMQDKGWEPELSIIDGERPYLSFYIQALNEKQCDRKVVAICELVCLPYGHVLQSRTTN